MSCCSMNNKNSYCGNTGVNNFSKSNNMNNSCLGEDAFSDSNIGYTPLQANQRANMANSSNMSRGRSLVNPNFANRSPRNMANNGFVNPNFAGRNALNNGAAIATPQSNAAFRAGNGSAPANSVVLPGVDRTIRQDYNINGGNYSIQNNNYYRDYYTRYNHYYINTTNYYKNFLSDVNVYHYSSNDVYEGCEYLGSTNIICDNNNNCCCQCPGNGFNPIENNGCCPSNNGCCCPVNNNCCPSNNGCCCCQSNNDCCGCGLSSDNGSWC